MAFMEQLNSNEISDGRIMPAEDAIDFEDISDSDLESESREDERVSNHQLRKQTKSNEDMDFDMDLDIAKELEEMEQLDSKELMQLEQDFDIKEIEQLENNLNPQLKEKDIKLRKVLKVIPDFVGNDVVRLSWLERAQEGQNIMVNTMEMDQIVKHLNNLEQDWNLTLFFNRNETIEDIALFKRAGKPPIKSKKRANLKGIIHAIKFHKKKEEKIIDVQLKPTNLDLPDWCNQFNIIDWESKIIWKQEEDQMQVDEVSSIQLEEGSNQQEVCNMQVDEASNMQADTSMQVDPNMQVDQVANNNIQVVNINSKISTVKNYDVETGEWDDLIVWDEKEVEKWKLNSVQLNLNDPNIIIDMPYDELDVAKKPLYCIQVIENEEEPDGPPKKKRPIRPVIKQNLPSRLRLFAETLDTTQPLDPFNISQDAIYEAAKKALANRRIRQNNLAKMIIQHAGVAIRLHGPFYRDYMSREELRTWHRPEMRFHHNEVIKFQRVKNLRKKKKDLTRSTTTSIEQDWLAHPKDITLKDNSHYVLFEYCEEYPPLLSNQGMGSFIVNYYRKKDEKDVFIPKGLDGTAGILEPSDASPFFGFGDVQPGQTVQAIKNNLFVAPIFQHQLKNPDFLIIKSKRLPKKDGGSMEALNEPENKWYIREIPRVYTVGQTFPIVEVQPPQSRKIKFYIRDRLMLSALRYYKSKGLIITVPLSSAEKNNYKHDNELMRAYGRSGNAPNMITVSSSKAGSIRFPMDKIVNSYHRYHEQTIRKYLKDIMDLSRFSKEGAGPGEHSWYITLKPNVELPAERDWYKLVTPESVCAFESMRVAQERLVFAGYTGVGDHADDLEDQADEDERVLDDEVKSAPWNTTKHFLQAVQNKGMIKLYGHGDPTGRNEGFSFYKASMKEMFMNSGASVADIEAFNRDLKSKTGHAFTLEIQQKFYRLEIDRIWNAQYKALSSSEEVYISDEERMQQGLGFEEEDLNTTINEIQEISKQTSKKPIGNDANGWIQVPRMSSVKSDIDAEETRQNQFETGSTTSSAKYTGSRVSGNAFPFSLVNQAIASNKVFMIRRKLKPEYQTEESKAYAQKYGGYFDEEEPVTDIRVINAYLKQKRLIDLTAGVGGINPEDDEATRARKLAEELKRLRKETGVKLLQEGDNLFNSEDSNISAKLSAVALVSSRGRIRKTPIAATPSSRKCKSCGEVGHISTNKICKNFAMTNPDRHERLLQEQQAKEERLKKEFELRKKKEAERLEKAQLEKEKAEQEALEKERLEREKIVKAQDGKLKISVAALQKEQQKKEEPPVIKLPKIVINMSSLKRTQDESKE